MPDAASHTAPPAATRPLRLLRFDMFGNRAPVLEKMQAHAAEVERMSRRECLDWLISLRSNYSDYNTHALSKLGWQCEEYVHLPVDIYWRKFIPELYGAPKSEHGVMGMARRLKRRLRPIPAITERDVIQDYTDRFKPDVLFVRDPLFDSRMWRPFRKKCLVVGRLGTVATPDWSPRDFDLIFTTIPEYKAFFELQLVPTHIVHDAFEPRLLNEVGNLPKDVDVSFVGQIGGGHFQRRTRLIEELAAKTELKWWGPWYDEFHADKPDLRRIWQGFVTGLDMYRVHRRSKIALNDYVDTAGGLALNQRMCEIMGMGTFMLTRSAPNLADRYPPGCMATFDDADDCVEKIRYYLAHEDERNAIAARGQQFVLEHHTYDHIGRQMDGILRAAWEKKFGHGGN